MVKKSLSVFGVLVLGVFGVLVFCNKDNPASPKPTDINGTWTGLTAIRSSGAGKPDTFSCVLTIGNTATTYSMLRGHVNYGSSGSTTDSAKESGSVTKIGTDSAVLTPFIGLKNSNRKRIASLGLLSMMVLRPSPTLALPAQA